MDKLLESFPQRRASRNPVPKTHTHTSPPTPQPFLSAALSLLPHSPETLPLIQSPPPPRPPALSSNSQTFEATQSFGTPGPPASVPQGIARPRQEGEARASHAGRGAPICASSESSSCSSFVHPGRGALFRDDGLNKFLFVTTSACAKKNLLFSFFVRTASSFSTRTCSFFMRFLFDDKNWGGCGWGFLFVNHERPPGPSCPLCLKRELRVQRGEHLRELRVQVRELVS